MRKPRLLLLFITLLTLASVFINLPNSVSFKGQTKDTRLNANALLDKLKVTKDLEYRQGLDLKGGVSLTFKADVEKLSSAEQESAIESARAVIEKRVNLFGVAEPLIQTAKVNKESRIIVELPGVTNVTQAINLIGATAQLTFWELTSSQSADLTNPLYPINASSLGPVKQTELTGTDLSQSNVVFDPNTGSPQVQLKFNSQGSKEFGDITKRNVGKPLAIALDNIIIEAPALS